MIDVIGIGSSLYDILMVTDSFPAEDTKLQSTMTLIQGGGPCATALATAARLGVSAAYMGTMGMDNFGRYMVDDLARYGVETRLVRFQENRISFHAVVILNQQNGSRTCVWSKGTVLPLSPEDLDETAIRQAKVLHLDGHELVAAIHAATTARQSGVKVSLDAGGTYPGIEKLLPLVDFLIPSEEFALKLTGESTPETAACKLFEAYQPEILVVTQGARGGFLYDGKAITRYPAYSVAVVDSNGAGDVFHGAFVTGFIKGMSFESCARFASSVSALKCTGLGARQSVPTFEEALAFLKERGERICLLP